MAHEGDVIQVLMTDHREMEEMFARLEQLPAGDSRRREVADELIREIVRHSIAEEAYVYPTIKEKLPDGERIAAKETSEHDEAERIMKELEGAEPGDPRFDQLVARLRAALREHIDDEESNVFPQLRQRTSQQDLDELAAKVNTIKKIAPTRPHPNAPNSPLTHKLLGPGIGLVDRARDLFSGRSG